MRIVFTLLASLLLLSGYTPDTITSKPAELNGTWVATRQEIGGKNLPGAAYKGQELIIRDTTYQLTAESVDKGVLHYANGKMDIYGKEGVNAGNHFTAIYQYKNNELTICYNLSGKEYPTAFETKSSSALFLSVFKKI